MSKMYENFMNQMNESENKVREIEDEIAMLEKELAEAKAAKAAELKRQEGIKVLIDLNKPEEDFHYEVTGKENDIITVYGPDIEMIYYRRDFGIGTSKFIVRSHGEVLGNNVYKPLDELWYKKQGRGRMKQEDKSWQLVKMADAFIQDQGFLFWNRTI